MKSNIAVIRVGIVDDHIAVTRAFTGLLNSMNGIEGMLEAFSGMHLFQLLGTSTALPDILLMDVEMKGMTGIEATKQVTALYPTIKVIAFTGKDDDWTILQMIGAGACAYLSKEIPPAQMEEAIHEVHRKGKYHADLCHLYADNLRRYSNEIKGLSFTENEKRYLQLLCKGYEYKRIAEAMNVTVSAINYYYTCISQKLNTKSQAIMALEALRMGIINRNEEKNIHVKQIKQ